MCCALRIQLDDVRPLRDGVGGERPLLCRERYLVFQVDVPGVL